jgi:adenylosuccinate synthase
MANIVIVGMQWGDEGKGKVVDLICPAFDVVVRYQGGHNAGHTVKFADRHFSLQLIPSGILHPGMKCVLGNGMVIAPDAFFSELDRLAKEGIEPGDRLFVSNRAHALLPWHAELDKAREEARGAGKIGTTSRGIGPAYEGKISRYGLRLSDLAAGPWADLRLGALYTRIAAELQALGAPPPTPLDEVKRMCREWGGRLAPMLRDTEVMLDDWITAGKSLLFEGAQGALLDIDHGTYPYVTSSNSTAGGACTGSGVPPTKIDGALGILKAYTTRVGGGPFATELEGEQGDFLRLRGNEYGTVTGRPRRCGWLDTVAARYARRLNGVEALALTKLDVLDDFDEIEICTAYKVRGQITRDLPGEAGAFESAKPVYETVKGWKSSTVGILDPADLPAAARAYIERIEEEVGARVEMVSTGPRREETIVDPAGHLAGWVGDRLDTVIAGRGV